MDPKTRSAFLRLERYADPQSLHNQKLLVAVLVAAEHLCAEVAALARIHNIGKGYRATVALINDWTLPGTNQQKRWIVEDTENGPRLTYCDSRKWWRAPREISVYTRETVTLKMAQHLAEWIRESGGYQRWLERGVEGLRHFAVESER